MLPAQSPYDALRVFPIQHYCLYIAALNILRASKSTESSHQLPSLVHHYPDKLLRVIDRFLRIPVLFRIAGIYAVCGGGVDERLAPIYSAELRKPHPWSVRVTPP